MEAVLRIIPSTAVAATNLWLAWLCLSLIGLDGAPREQAALQFFYALLRAGIPVTLISIAVVLGTYLSESAHAKHWRIFWATNAALPALLGAIGYAL